ncbi:hypothetical protein [Xanthobacter sp. ZOL 2024]
MKTPSVLVMLCVALLAAGAGAARACGYHPGLSSDTFDAVHPRSLGVAVALNRAQNDGMLPPAPAGLPGFPGQEYRRAVRELQELQERLTRVAPRFAAAHGWRFAFVFVRSRLWAQYTVGPEGARVEVHTPPAGAGEAVVLSDEAVLAAILSGKLTVKTAREAGLLQFADDGDEAAQRILSAALERAPVGQ